MRARTTLTAAAILVWVLLAPTTEARAQDKLTPAEAKAIARDAFIFGMPSVYIEKQQQILTAVPKPEGTRAPYNQFAHYRDFPDPNNRTVVIWNVDTLYSIASLDVTNEPIVLSIPPMGDRWWLMQLLDNWNDVPAAPGTRTEGGGGGDYALCGPNFKGTLPSGLKEVRVDTSSRRHRWTHLHCRGGGPGGGAKDPGSIQAHAALAMARQGHAPHTAHRGPGESAVRTQDAAGRPDIRAFLRGVLCAAVRATRE